MPHSPYPVLHIDVSKLSVNLYLKLRKTVYFLHDFSFVMLMLSHDHVGMSSNPILVVFTLANSYFTRSITNVSSSAMNFDFIQSNPV